MTTYASGIAQYHKQLVRYVKITLDRCSNVFGDAASGGVCTGSSTQCHYSYHTCVDRTNYQKTTRDYWFQDNAQPLTISIASIKPVRPMLVNVGPISTRLDPELGLTKHSRLEFTFAQDWGDNAPLPIMDHDKRLASGTERFNEGRNGEFWKNLFTRNPNYKGRAIEYYHGFSDATATTDFQLKWVGVIENVEFSDGKCIVTATDKIKRVQDRTAPNVVSSTNTTRLEVDNDDRSIVVDDASEFDLLPRWMFQARTDGAGNALVNFASQEDGAETLVKTHAYATTMITGLAWDKFDRTFTFLEGTGTPGEYYLRRMDSESYDVSTEHTVSGIGALDATHDVINSKIYTTDGTNLYYINTGTGSGITVGAFGGGYTNVQGLAYDYARRTLYGINGATADTLLTINLTTGTATSIGTAGLGTITLSDFLADDDVNDRLVAYDQTNTRYITISKTTGAATEWINLSGNNPTTLAFRDVQLPVVKINDSSDILGDTSEYLELLAINESTNTLTVERSPLYGGTAYSHGLGLKVNQTAVFAQRSTAAITVSNHCGINAVTALIQLLCAWCGFNYTDIDYAAWITEGGEWHPSTTVRRIMNTPIKADALFRQLQQLMVANVWQDEDREIQFKAFSPVNQHTETLNTLNATSGVLKSTRRFDNNAETHTTRVVIYYDPIDPSKESTKPEDYLAHYLRADVDIESPNSFDSVVTIPFFMPWAFQEADARRMATKQLRRFRIPPAKFSFSVDAKDRAIKVGDIVEITCREFLDVDGDQIATQCEVIEKSEQGSVIDFEVMDAKLDRRYGWIAHSGAADWGAATATEKLHAYIGTWIEETDSAEMSDGTDGTYIF